MKDRRGFTLVEVLLNSFIILLVVLAGISIYIMVWRWWYETAPEAEVQRVARVTLMRVVEGVRQDSLGSDTIGVTTYRRRNGFSETALTNANPTPTSPVITAVSADQDSIAFRLEPDTSNSRTYAVGTVSAGVEALYYSGSIVPATRITGRLYLTCDPVAGYSDLYKVTVRAEKDVAGTRQAAYTAAAEYSDYVYLRNI